ncbi:MAG: dihydrofolate reductase family protein [Actinomycetota bacterium]
MGTLVIDMFVTLDGVAQGPGAPDEDRGGGFEHGGWQAPFFGEEDESGRIIGENIERMDALLLGRKTYEIFASYWPQAPKDLDIATKLNAVPKYVASRTLTSADWTNSTVIDGDAADQVAKLKESHNEIHVIGSIDLAQTLLGNELVDRINLWIYPVVLGTGKRLFSDGAVPTALRLVQSATFPNGSVLLVYETTGKPTYGNLGE